ncbi:MAG: hypothetical protein WDO56_35060 [Gammaproteobacteria bacterium]
MTAADRRDAELGIAWWNALPEYSRALWLTRAGSACPADAWTLYKAMTFGPGKTDHRHGAP